MCENYPQSIAELKVAITQKVRAIRKEECVRVIDNFACRLQMCLRCNGGHLEHVHVSFKLTSNFQFLS